MALESVTNIADLVITNPTATDPKSEGDDHIRNIKKALKNDLPNITGPITASQAELNVLDGITASTAELNLLDGVTATTAELNYIDGVTSPIQTQLDGKQPLDADLTAIAGLSAAGMVARTGAGTASVRTLTAGAGITITNGDGVSGNPTISVDSGGLPASASSALISYLPAGTGAVSTTVQSKLREWVSVFDFMTTAQIADVQAGTALLDVTEAIQAAYTYLRNQAPINSLYAGVVYLPRGVYLVNGVVNLNATGGGYPNSVIFVGDSAGATTIKRTVDSGIVFDVNIYLNLEFRDIRFNHETSENRSTWSNVLFDLNGDGGGNRFRLSGITTNGFSKIINFSGTVGNQDTTTVEKCQFNNFKTFLYIRNANASQAVVNSFRDITWFGYVDKVFDIGGYGNTHIDTCNVVQSGDFLSLHFTGSGNASQYLCTNVRFEYWNGPAANNSNGTTRFVFIPDEQVGVNHIKFIGCSVSPRTDMDPSIYQFDLQGGTTTLKVSGGTWSAANIRTKGRSDKAALNAWWVIFEDLINSPNPQTNVIRTNSSSNASAHIPIVFRNCAGVSNITLRGPGNAFTSSKSAGTGFDRNNNTVSGAVGYLLNTSVLNTTTTHSVPGYGALQLIERIRFFIQLSGSGSPTVVLRAYKDAALTQQVGADITVTSYASPAMHEVSIPANTFTTEGVYLTVTNTVGASAIIFGLIYVDTLSV